MLTKKFLTALQNFIESERYENIVIDENALIDQDWGVDSLDKAILEMFLEQEYGIPIDSWDLIRNDLTLMSLGEICEFCEDKYRKIYPNN